MVVSTFLLELVAASAFRAWCRALRCSCLADPLASSRMMRRCRI